MAIVVHKLAALALLAIYPLCILLYFTTDGAEIYSATIALVPLVGAVFSFVGLLRPGNGFVNPAIEISLVVWACVFQFLWVAIAVAAALKSPQWRGNSDLVPSLVLMSAPQLVALPVWMRVIRRRFSLRTLLLVVLGLGLVGTWIANLFHSRVQRHMRELPAIQRVEKLNGTVYFEDWVVKGINLKDSAVQDEDMELISQLTEVESLSIANTKLSDASLPQILKMKKLQHVYLYGSMISKDAVKQIRKAIPRIRNLPDE